MWNGSKAEHVYPIKGFLWNLSRIMLVRINFAWSLVTPWYRSCYPEGTNSHRHGALHQWNTLLRKPAVRKWVPKSMATERLLLINMRKAKPQQFYQFAKRHMEANTVSDTLNLPIYFCVAGWKLFKWHHCNWNSPTVSSHLCTWVPDNITRVHPSIL